MTAIKKRILGAITIMSNSDAEKVWDFMSHNLSPRSWEDIGEVSPDEWDLKMLEDIEKNPDRRKFLFQEKVLKELGITL